MIQRIQTINFFVTIKSLIYFFNKMEHNDIEEVKNRLVDFEIPKKERLMKLKLIQKLIENTDENNLNENLKAITKMLTDVKKIYYFNVSDLLK